MDNSPVAPVVGTLVPGIGDEVVAGITCLLGTVLVIGIAYIVLKQTQQNSIHPGQVRVCMCVCVCGQVCCVSIWACTKPYIHMSL